MAQDHAVAARIFCRERGPVAAERAAECFGVDMLALPLSPLVDAITIDGAIVVRQSLLPWEREHAGLHELGHWLIHGGIGGYHFWKRHGYRMHEKLEEQAEAFAYFFALPGDELLSLLRGEVPEQEIALRYWRSVAWVRERIRLAVTTAKSRRGRGWRKGGMLSGHHDRTNIRNAKGGGMSGKPPGTTAPPALIVAQARAQYAALLTRLDPLMLESARLQAAMKSAGNAGERQMLAALLRQNAADLRQLSPALHDAEAHLQSLGVAAPRYVRPTLPAHEREAMRRDASRTTRRKSLREIGAAFGVAAVIAAVFGLLSLAGVIGRSDPTASSAQPATLRTITREQWLAALSGSQYSIVQATRNGSSPGCTTGEIAQYLNEFYRSFPANRQSPATVYDSMVYGEPECR